MQRKALDRVRQAPSVKPRPSVRATRREAHRRIKINRRKLRACETQATDDNELPSAKSDLFAPSASVSDNAVKLVDSQASRRHTKVATPKSPHNGDSLHAVNKTDEEEEPKVGAQKVKRSMIGATDDKREVESTDIQHTTAKKRKMEADNADNSIMTVGEEEKDWHIKCTGFDLHMKNVQGEMKTNFVDQHRTTAMARYES